MKVDKAVARLSQQLSRTSILGYQGVGGRLNMSFSRLQTERAAGQLVGIGVAVTLVVALALRAYWVDRTSLWLDEALSWGQANRSFLEMIAATAADNHPPLYNTILHFTILSFGDSEISLRTPSVIFGMAAIYLTYRLGTNIWCKTTGLIAATFLTLSGFHVWYSTEAKGYTLFTAIAILYIMSVFAVSRKDNWQNIIIYGISATLLLYTHVYGSFLFLSINICILIAIKCTDSVVIGWRQWCAAQLFPCLAFLPWGIILLHQKDTLGRGGYWLPKPSLDIVRMHLEWIAGGGLPLLILTTLCFLSCLQTTQSYRQGTFLKMAYPWMVLNASLLVALWAWLLIYYDKARNGWGYWLPTSPPGISDSQWGWLFGWQMAPALSAGLLSLTLFTITQRETTRIQISFPHAVVLSWLIGPLVFGVSLSQLMEPIFSGRYIICSLPALMLLAARGVTRMNINRIAVVALSLLTWLSLAPATYHYAVLGVRDDNRSAVAYFLSNASPDDFIVFHESPNKVAFEYYGKGRKFREFKYREILDHESGNFTFNRIWLSSWLASDEDVEEFAVALSSSHRKIVDAKFESWVYPGLRLLLFEPKQNVGKNN